jgi:2-keto-4-pentenoate hydratase/2-oxohepta-3-ene-1,7-dioic acid hydratase in catechol pathway
MTSYNPSKIVCIGRNYLGHARELGNDVPERPLIFLKPPSAVIADGEAIVLPPDSNRVDHEGEIGILIGKKARHVSEEEAFSVVAGYMPINDVTARDLQKIDVQFTRAKGFDTFCPVGSKLVPASTDWRSLEVICRVNGAVRQHGKASDMAFGVPAIIAFISRVMTLLPGDLIATGTPEGIAPLSVGDDVEVELVGHSKVSNPVIGFESVTAG